MSKHPERLSTRTPRTLLALAALCAAGTVTSLVTGAAVAAPAVLTPSVAIPTVTLAEYRNAQRIALDAEARKKVEGASAAAAQASVGAIPVVPAIAPGAAAIPLAGASAPIAIPKVPAAPPEPRILISGLAAIKGEWRAEVSTEFGVHLLSVGQQIPGTEWLMGPIRPERVTLLKPERRLRNGKLAREQVRTLALGQELL